MSRSDDTFRTRLDMPYEQAVARVTEALKTEGIGILTEIDVQATLKKKLDVDFRSYVILGACNPPLAHRALTAEVEIGLLLPCNVIVYEDDHGSVVAIADPVTLLEVAGNPAVTPVAEEARAAAAGNCGAQRVGLWSAPASRRRQARRQHQRRQDSHIDDGARLGLSPVKCADGEREHCGAEQ